MVFKCIQYYYFGLLVGSPTFWIYFHCFSWLGAYYNQVISWVDEIHYSFNILMFDIVHKIMDDWITSIRKFTGPFSAATSSPGIRAFSFDRHPCRTFTRHNEIGFCRRTQSRERPLWRAIQSLDFGYFWRRPKRAVSYLQNGA